MAETIIETEIKTTADQPEVILVTKRVTVSPEDSQACGPCGPTVNPCSPASCKPLK